MTTGQAVAPFPAIFVMLLPSLTPEEINIMNVNYGVLGMLVMLGVAGPLSILLSEPLASSYSSMLSSPRRGGKSLEVGSLAGRAANLRIFHHHFLPVQPDLKHYGCSGLYIGIQSDGERLIINFSASNDIPMCTCNN